MPLPKLHELKCDVEDLNKLMSLASRQRSKDLLTLEIRKLQTEISRLQEESNNTVTVKPSAPALTQPNKCYEVKLNNYAWDQSDKEVKIYVTLKNVHTLPLENISVTLTDNNSMELRVNGLENRNYLLSIKNLLEKVCAGSNALKVKTDKLVVSLTKVQTGTTWTHLTVFEKKTKDPKPSPKGDTSSSDPSAGLMDLMKQMYEDGDDEMKRTIAKAWTEGRNNSGMPSF